jgi:hypothetical protein
VILPIGHIFTSREWVLNRDYVTVQGQNMGMSSHVYNNGILGGSHIIFTGIGNAINIDHGRGVSLSRFGVATNRAIRHDGGTVTTNMNAPITSPDDGKPARDSDTVGVRIGLTDNASLDLMSFTQIGKAVNADCCDTPKLTRLWICEAGAGILLTTDGQTGFHGHVTGCTIADLSGRNGIGPNGGYGVKIANSYQQAQVYNNTFARNNGDVIITGNSSSNVVVNNTFKESNGISVLIEGAASNTNIVHSNLSQVNAVQAIVVNGGEFNSVQINSLGNTSGAANIQVGPAASGTIVNYNPANTVIVDQGVNTEIHLAGTATISSTVAPVGLNSGATFNFNSPGITYPGGLSATSSTDWVSNNVLAYNFKSTNRNYSFFMGSAGHFKLIATRNNTTASSTIITTTPAGGGVATQYGSTTASLGATSTDEPDVVIFDSSALAALPSGTLVTVSSPVGAGTMTIQRVVAA